MKDYSKFFDAAYVINLDRRTDRWENISSAAEKAGLALTRFSAFPASEVNLDVHRIGTRVKKPSCVACTISHWGVYRDALGKGYERVLVFEDDADIPEDLYEKLEELFSGSGIQDFDALYLGGADKYPSAPINDHIALSQFTLLAHAIIFTRAGMQHIIDTVDTRDDSKIRMTSDVFLAEELQPRNRTYQSVRNIVRVISSKSDLAGSNRNWNSLVRDCITQGLKNPKKWAYFEERSKTVNFKSPINNTTTQLF